MEQNEEQIAIYLKKNPDFFLRHNNIVELINLQGRSGNKTISLHERQVQVLRNKIKTLEDKLNYILAVGKQNDLLQQKIHAWLGEILRIPRDKLLPFAIIRTLKQHFDIPQIALRLWKTLPEYAEQEYTSAIATTDWVFVNKLSKPYCGAPSNITLCRWLPDNQAIQSLAILALRAPSEQKSRGVLLFGANDKNRFTCDMSTDLLRNIADLTTAMLQYMHIGES